MGMKPVYQELPFSEGSLIDFYKEDLPHFIVPWHTHSKIEIMHIVSGSGTRFVGDHVEEYQMGDTCLIGAQLPHEWRSGPAHFRPGSAPRAVCYCIFFDKEIFEDVFIRLPEMANIRGLLNRSRRGIKFVGESRERIGAFVRKIIGAEGSAKITGLISLLELMAVSEEYELLASDGYTKADNRSDFERFDKIYHYVQTHFAEEITLGEMAARIGLTPPAFCRYFNKRTGTTFVRYLNEIRIGHAKKQLIGGDTKIAAVCFESGFRNLSHFIEQFRRSTGLTPSEYRKMHGFPGRDGLD